ncbi:hypothetical protein NDU88_000610 [Pleurodeles waltl]|uniref:Uncharacterized protein n=1 Tax=Pleurodeles waltl TaxID=8319 RepID=A0AAV7MQB4_PLEWA|nr:hypothetical protein NDU88_000610 [Pleurodeles waltl]
MSVRTGWWKRSPRLSHRLEILNLHMAGGADVCLQRGCIGGKRVKDAPSAGRPRPCASAKARVLAASAHAVQFFHLRLGVDGLRHAMRVGPVNAGTVVLRLVSTTES